MLLHLHRYLKCDSLSPCGSLGVIWAEERSWTLGASWWKVLEVASLHCSVCVCVWDAVMQTLRKMNTEMSSGIVVEITICSFFFCNQPVVVYLTLYFCNVLPDIYTTIVVTVTLRSCGCFLAVATQAAELRFNANMVLFTKICYLLQWFQFLKEKHNSLFCPSQDRIICVFCTCKYIVFHHTKILISDL